jgi:hypothetical protein
MAVLGRRLQQRPTPNMPNAKCSSIPIMSDGRGACGMRLLPVLGTDAITNHSRVQYANQKKRHRLCRTFAVQHLAFLADLH